MKGKIRIFSVLLFFGILFAGLRPDTVLAENNVQTDVLTVKYYVDTVQEQNYIGQQEVAYSGLTTVTSVDQLQLDSQVLQAYHGQGQAAQRYRSGKLVSYDPATQTACVLYTKVAYTVQFYKDSVTSESVGSVVGYGYIGDVVNNRYLGKEVRNTFRPESGYLSGQVYQKVTLSDADGIVVKVIYHPIVEQSKIYFYNVAGTADYGTDAILIESNGHFGLVDCGEDLDYPKGTDPKYPLRDGIVTKQYADPQELINFISSKGVTELDFIIFSHAHSDHMGAADEIIRAFDVDKIYAREYDDKYINNQDRLYDTQYVYDCMVQAANKYGATLIQNFDVENTSFDFQDLKIQIKNYETDYEADGVTRQAKWDDNENSLGVLVTDSYGNKIFLAGDIDNVDGDEDKLAADTDLQNLTVLKVAHHGLGQSSTENFLNTVRPRYAVITNTRVGMNQDVYNRLANLGSQMYFVLSCKEGITLDVPQITFTKEKEYSGWNDNTGLKASYYYVNGEKVRNCAQVIDGKEYRFYGDGAAYTSEWYEDETTGAWYYYGVDHVMVKDNWVLYKDKYYYTDKDGKMVTDQWIISNGKNYYLNEQGIMVAGDWFTIDGKTYYFDQNGARMEGTPWLLIDGEWYYLNSDFSRKENSWVEYKNDWYYVNQKGKMETSKWAQRDNKWYYLKSDGTVYEGTGWCQLKNTWYYLQQDGARTDSQWISSGTTWYYVDADGKMLSNEWGLVNGRWYFFKSSGAMVSDGWHKIHNKWYYFEKSGAMYENQWILYKEKWYYMGPGGAMVASDWALVNGKWYYFDGNGYMLENCWGYINAKWYYFGKGGAMYENQWLKYNGSWYYLKSNGAMMTSGWVLSSGSWYYLQADGTMAVNTTINGKYKINKQGIWVK